MTSATQVDLDFERLLDYVKANRGFDFTGYKRPSLARRTRKRMDALGIDTYDRYLDYLESNPDEFIELFNTILINVTGFFRDRENWQYVDEEIVPRILESKSLGETIRVWCPGCASGEEVYTAAMIFANALDGQPETRLKVYGTDVDDEALTKARQAAYTPKEIEDVPDHYRKRYFEREESRYALDRNLRRQVIFGRHDLVRDAPISRVDLVICRNTLMYLNAETQTRVLENFNFALLDHGYLFLGKSEMLLTRSQLFTPVDVKRRVFRRVARGDLREGIRTFTDASPQEQAELLRVAGFDAGGPAQLVVDGKGMLTLANQHARALFSLGPSDIGRPIQDLELSYRPVELRSLIQAALIGRRPAVVRDVRWQTQRGDHVFEVQVAPLTAPTGELLGAGVTFVEVTKYTALRDELERSKDELERAYEELQSSNEELETTNEELQSANEELETANEELQSTNEELETMNEELQSANEELETMNSEFRQQTIELNRVNAFLETVLTGLGPAVVVLDGNLRVLSWNATAEEMWGLTFLEVRGKRFFDLDIGLPMDALMNNVDDCLSGRSSSELVLPAVNRRGKKIDSRVQCRPLSEVTGNERGVLVLVDEQAPDDET